MNRRMKIIFTLSILLNIVFIGAGVGMFYRFCQEIPIPGDMSPEARSFVARTYQNGREEIRPLIKEVKERRRTVEQMLMRDDFDRKSYDTAVDQLLETQQKIMRRRADTMGKAVTDLSAEDRKKFSRQIIDGLTPGRPKWGRPHGPQGGDRPPEAGNSDVRTNTGQ